MRDADGGAGQEWEAVAGDSGAALQLLERLRKLEEAVRENIVSPALPCPSCIPPSCFPGARQERGEGWGFLFFLSFTFCLSFFFLALAFSLK